MVVRLDTSLELLLKAPQGVAEPGVLATIVTTAGSTYRKSGARMLIRPDGSYIGLLSGGCLEADLSGHASKVQKDSVPRSVEYDMRGPDDLLFGIGAGCEGAMRVLLEPAGAGRLAATALAAAAPAINAGRPTVLIVVHHSADLALGTYAAAAGAPESELPPALLAAAQEAIVSASSRSVEIDLAKGCTRALVHYIAAAPHLLICGAGPDAEPVVSTASTLGWRVTVVDHRPAYAQGARFPGARVILGDASQLCRLVNPAECHAAIVMSHHLASDTAYLRSLAEADAPGYIGLLGPAARRRRLAAEIGPLTERLRGRLRGPVGLNIGAVTPEGIALAIIAQIHAWIAEPHRSTPSNSPVF
jgi:xanthine/CO dehydrogenase XdhC/CoxF family maturation factor